MTLTHDQQTALTAFREFLTHPNEPVFLLRGYAGTGKTTLLKTLLAELTRPAMLLAPTGRAARVMTQQSGREATTIHRHIYDFTHLQPLATEQANAEKSFKLFFGLASNQAPVGTVFVVDEASMVADAFSESEFFRLGSGHLLRDLLAYVQPTPANGYKLLLVGDRAQLPPVGDRDSWALDADWLRQHLGRAAGPEVELTEVVRQQADSGILANATVVRESIRRQHFAGLKLTPAPDVQQLLPGELLPAYLRAGGRPEALDEAIVVTYSNNLARAYNTQIRGNFFPGQATVQVGDRLILTQNNYLEPNNPVYNGEFAAVQQVGAAYSRNVRINVNKTSMLIPLTWRPVRLRFTQPDGTPCEVERLLLDDFLNSPDNALRSEQVKALYVDAVMRWKQRGSDFTEKHSGFGKYLKNDGHFHALRAKYGYAVTCHKAQGGTWRTAFVDFAGHSGQAHAHYFRWVYTAITRASQQLYLVNDGSFTPWERMRVFDPNATQPTPGGVALCPEVQRAQTAQFDELAELEERLGITNRPVAQMQQFRRVAGQLRDRGIDVETVQNDGEYALRYHLRRGSEQSNILAYFKKDIPFSNAQPKGKANALTQEAVACLNAPLPPNIAVVPVTFGPNELPTLASFYEQFSEAVASQDISILNVQHHRFAERYQLQDATGRAELTFNYDGNGRITVAQLTKHDSPDLAAKLAKILRGLN